MHSANPVPTSRCASMSRWNRSLAMSRAGAGGEPRTCRYQADHPAPLRLLIVDDDRFARIMLAGLLTASDLKVTQAENGHEAMNCYAREAFDIVLTDLRMPVMDGETFATRLREHEDRQCLPSCRLIALAALIESPEITLLTDGLFDAALEKPALIDQVLEAIFQA